MDCGFPDGHRFNFFHHRLCCDLWCRLGLPLRDRKLRGSGWKARKGHLFGHPGSPLETSPQFSKALGLAGLVSLQVDLFENRGKAVAAAIVSVAKVPIRY